MSKEILPEELHEAIKNGNKVSVIDVREDEEVAQGMIPGATHIPLGELPDRLKEIDPKEEHIMVCRSGGRSGRACEFLQQQGYQVKNMVGGMIAWEAKYKED